MAPRQLRLATSPFVSEAGFCIVMLLLNPPTVCDSSDLLVPGVSWNETAGFNNDSMGIYLFPGGNVTLNGVSLGSTATYTTNESYLVNGSVTRRCLNNGSWTPSTEIIEGDVNIREEMIFIYSMFVFLISSSLFKG